MAAREDELKALMIGALDGNAAAYQSLLRLLVPQLRAFFHRRVRNADLVEDLAQETLMALHARRATFDRDRPFSPWLFAIARYKIADHFRKHRPATSINELEEHIASFDYEPANSAALDVERLLNSLPQKQGRAIRATKIEGLSIAEAAAAAGIGSSDAKVSVHRGLKRLARHVRGKLS